MDLKLKSKVALITGGSKGIGLSTARVFAQEGCDLGICGRDSQDLAVAKAELEGFGVLVAAIKADVCQPNDAAAFVDGCLEALGGIDILVNNVGGSKGAASILEASDEDWESTFQVTMFQGVRMARLVAPYMKARGGGVIINISSISGWSAQLAGSAQYGSAKAAVIFLTERMALELVHDKIRVNTVSPSSIQHTQGWERYRSQSPMSYETYVRDGFPMGRLGNPEEVADVIVFLASPRANWINGRNVPVDGLEQPVPVAERRPW